MRGAAARFDFEQAAKYRDGMEAVNLLLSKRDVIEFAEENHSIVVYEYLDEDTIKLFLIKRNVVLHSERCSVAATVEIESLRRRVKALILSYFTRDTECDAAEVTGKISTLHKSSTAICRAAPAVILFFRIHGSKTMGSLIWRLHCGIFE